MQADLRPFYFIVTFWGKKYRDYFLNWCLPSILCEGNWIDRPRKLIVACPPEDRPPVKGIEFVDIPPCPEGVSPCEHMGGGHVLLTARCYRDKAYAIPLTPDMLLSEGTIPALDRHAKQGRRVVLAAAQRFEEERFLNGLASLKPRDLVRKIFPHSEMARQAWNAPYYDFTPTAVWWKAPGGLLVHSLSWASILLDYGALKNHDTSCLETWTMDGDYVFKNWGFDDVYAVTDSDEAFVASWSPAGSNPRRLQDDPLYDRGIGTLIRGAMLRHAYYSDVFDPLKRKLFMLPVRWHSEDFDWAEIEREAQKQLGVFL